jgi:hypothetical protein
MTVVSTTNIALKPGGYEAFLDQTRKSKELLERCGAKKVRVLATLLAGQATGGIALAWEAGDHAKYGAVMDKFLADPEGSAMIIRTSGADSPIASFQSSLWIEIDL